MAKLEGIFSIKKTTKNTVVFEQSSEDATKIASVIYFDKDTVGTLGLPEKLKVTIEPM